jgi:hypothetical protein
MMPFKMSWMHLFERVGTLYGENGAMPLHQEFDYESIFTWPKRTRFSFPMWWLLIRCGGWWLWMSLFNQRVQLWNLMPLLRSASIEDFKKGTTLFQCPWRCIAHTGVIWECAHIFSMIDDQEVTYPCFFTFNFLSIMLLLLFSML